MTNSQDQTAKLIDQLKDKITPFLVPEYHRLNNKDERQYLPSIEVFLGAVVAMFLVPYVKKIAEKAAEATWTTIFRKSVKERKYNQIESLIPPDSAKILMQSSKEQQNAALSEAELSLEMFLEEYGMPNKVRLQIKNNIILFINNYHNNKEV